MINRTSASPASPLYKDTRLLLLHFLLAVFNYFCFSPPIDRRLLRSLSLYNSLALALSLRWYWWLSADWSPNYYCNCSSGQAPRYYWLCKSCRRRRRLWWSRSCGFCFCCCCSWWWSVLRTFGLELIVSLVLLFVFLVTVQVVFLIYDE